MTNFYKVTEKLRDTLNAEPFINTVTYGSISEVDLDKKTIFPLAHMLVGNVELQESTMLFDINILFMDIVDISKDETEDKFLDNDNSHDILNTQLAVVGRLSALLDRGELWDEQIQLVGNPTAEPFEDRFANKLTGWSLSLQIEVPNDSSTC